MQSARRVRGGELGVAAVAEELDQEVPHPPNRRQLEDSAMPDQPQPRGRRRRQTELELLQAGGREREAARQHARADAVRRIGGYRQYLWRGLNLEASALVMRSRVDSTADGMRYVGLNVFIAATAGWRFDVPLGGAAFYVLPQIGAGRDVLRTDPPPTAVHITLVGELLIGIRF